MSTAIGKASIRRLVAPTVLPRLIPLVSRRLAASILATTQSRTFSISRCRALPAAQTKAKPARKTAAKKKTTKAKATKKAAPKKKKKAAKPKKVVAKKKPKKVISPEKKAAADKKDLRAKALLKTPAKLPETTWLVYLSQELKGTRVGDLAGTTKSLSQSFRALSEAQVEALKSTAEKNKLSNSAAYKAWIESYPPEEVWEANRARARLSRTYKVSLRKLVDDRLPKKPSTAYSLFVKARWASGDITADSAAKASPALAAEWKSLPAGEKQAYQDLATAAGTAYEAAKKSITG